MPYEKFPVMPTPEATLKLWARKLEYLFANLDTDNVSSTSLLGTDSVKDYMIDFGTGLQQVDALDVPIVDSTNHYTSTSVEGALAEIGVHMDTTNIHYLTTNINHTVLQNIGTNSHAQIDSHISGSTLHLIGASTAISAAVSTGLIGSTDLTVAVALSSDLIRTNSLVNEIRLALINRGISS